MMTCPHCQKPVRVLVFHENGESSCHQCAPEVRKLIPVKHTEKAYQKTARGYQIAR